MSYSGTVRCGYCRDKGHNITSCPKLKENYKLAKDKEKAGDTLCWSENSAIHMYERVQRRKKRKNTTRRCSYCRGLEHNRTTCQLRKDDIALCRKAQDIALKRYRDAVMETGIFHGAMITCTDFPNLQDGKKTAFMFKGKDRVLPILNMAWQPNGRSEDKKATIDFYRSDRYKQYEQMFYTDSSYFTRADRFFGSNSMYGRHGYSSQQINISIGDLKVWLDRPEWGYERNEDANYTIYKAKGLQPEKVLAFLKLHPSTTIYNKHPSGYECYVTSISDKKIISYDEKGLTKAYTRPFYSSNDARESHFMNSLSLYVEAFTEKK